MDKNYDNFDEIFSLFNESVISVIGEWKMSKKKLDLRNFGICI